MSTLTDAERAERDAYNAMIMQLILSGVGDRAPDEVSTTYQFAITPTRVPNLRYDGQDTMVTSVSVEVTRYPATARPEDKEGYVRVNWHGKQVTKAGSARQRGTDQYGSLPIELAGPLLLAGMMRTGVGAVEAPDRVR